MATRYRTNWPPDTEPYTLILWMSEDQRTVLEAMADAGNLTIEEVVETILNDWAHSLVVGFETGLLRPGDKVGSFDIMEPEK